MEKLDPNELPPLPDNLEDAHKEIRYLQRVLYNERVTWVRKLEKLALDNKSLAGQLNKVRNELKEVVTSDPSKPKGAWEI